MQKLANVLRYSGRTILLLLGSIIFLFGLFSGAEMQNGIINGIIHNSPNALPGLGILLLTAVAWRHELIGGILTSLFGFFLIYFFNFSGGHFFPVTFAATLLITTLGFFFLGSWKLHRNLNQLNQGNLG